MTGAWFKGPEASADGDLYKSLVNALYAVPPVVRYNSPHACWVMNLDWYRRIRAMAVTEEQESARALSHATALIPVSATFPLRCPSCTAGPFATMDDLAAHAAAMADPANREPADGDCLLGIPVTATDDGGAPHIENRNYPADLHARPLPGHARHRRAVPRQLVDRPQVGRRRPLAQERHPAEAVPRRRRPAVFRPTPRRAHHAAPGETLRNHMSGRRRSLPEVHPCRLCGDLAQATIHFDADWWKAIRAAAERELAEVRAEIAEADKHIRMLSTAPPA